MPIVDASKHVTEASSKIMTYAQSKKFQFIAERMLHTPLYNDRNHVERVAIMNDEIVAFICVTLDWDRMVATSTSILAFEESLLTVRLLIKTAYMVYGMGFSEINFAACEGNAAAVAMWDRIVNIYFEGGRSFEDFTTRTHTGVHNMITWRIFPKLEKVRAC